ncbi:MAG: hypothetical protein ACJZ0Y_01045 [Cytophagales bacterium]|nr:MAG: hypothetical protein CND83_04310 [Rhodothermaeota bacterium MED-G19]
MKCITDLGNSFFKILGTGVVKTTSPIEENLIIKIFTLLFVFILSIQNLKSQSNLESIIYQKKRIEFEIKYLDRSFWTSSNKYNLILVQDQETGKKLNWKISTYNRLLENLKDTTFQLDRSFSLTKIISEESNFKLFYKKNYSNEKTYLLINYLPNKNSIKIKEIQLPLSLDITNIFTHENKIVFSSKMKNGKNLLSIYNLDKNQLFNVYEYLYRDKIILKLKKINSNYFSVLTSERTKNNLKKIEREVYNLEGEKIYAFQINSTSHSIVDTKIIDYKNISYSISLFGNKNSNEAIGVQFDKFIYDSLISSERKYFLEINPIIDFMNIEKKNVIRKLNNKNISNLKFGYELHLDTIFIDNDNINFSIESIKADYSNDGFSNYSYIPFYNTYSGTYDRKINPNFGGYSHDINLFMKFNLDGKLIWSSISKMNSFNTFSNRAYNNYILKENELMSFYINKGEISFKEFSFSGENKTFKIDLNMIDAEDIKISNETNPEGTFHWYLNNYYTIGVQKIKNKKAIEKKNKRVFYITNFEIRNKN